MNPDVAFYPNSITNTSEALESGHAESPKASRHIVLNLDGATSIATIKTATPDETAAADEELLRLVTNKSKTALAALFHRHASKVFHVAQRVLKDDSEAEDLMQDVFVFIFQKARLFDPCKGTAVSWIIQAAYHRAIDRRRYLVARHHYSSKEVDYDQQAAARGRVSIDDIAGRAILDRFREELTAEQRETLELHFFEGYTFHEIAERTGQGFGNVRHHYYRGLERLRSFVFPGKKRQK